MFFSVDVNNTACGLAYKFVRKSNNNKQTKMSFDRILFVKVT